MKKVAIIILNWNGKKLLQEFIPSVIQYTDKAVADVIVADNNSDDDSVSFLKTNYPDVSIIQLTENFGYAEGYNQALKKITYEYYILLNSDVEVTEGWLTPLIEYLDNHLEVAALQPKILSQRDKQYFEYAGASGGFIDKYGYPFCRGRIFDSVEKDVHQYDTPIEIFWASGACMAIRAEDFHDCGGFDSTFFAHMEEIDLCWRLNARGRKLMCIPQSTVYHVGGATLDEESPRKTFLNFRNNLLMLYKNLPEDRLKHVMRTRTILDRIAALQMYLKGKKENAKAIIDAIKEFNQIKRQYTATRKDNLNRTTAPIIHSIYPQSILWSYFIKKRKHFGQLKF